MTELVPPGYKLTEVGVIPEEWEVKTFGELAVPLRERIDPRRTSIQHFCIELEHIESKSGQILGSTSTSTQSSLKSVFHPGDVLFGKLRAYLRKYWQANCSGVCSTEIWVFVPRNTAITSEFLFQIIQTDDFIEAASNSYGTHMPRSDWNVVKNHELKLPSLPEQRAIAAALSDVDALITALDQLIAKKRNLKQATMQQLLTGEMRLPGFCGEWVVKRLGEIADSLDNLRVPLNEAQREKMKGDYPYCGANGVLGFVDNYIVDDDIILMAEDGGYFDEYETRPIAYRMTGKCWVNNHSHILKAKFGFDQRFLFFSLVHKNILPFLASGTRAKLNKSEMEKIEVRLPKDLSEQTAIAAVLSDMDAELAALETRREKTQDLKQAMMQELLTGRIRLV